MMDKLWQDLFDYKSRPAPVVSSDSGLSQLINDFLKSIRVILIPFSSFSMIAIPTLW
jgi:hypothetical protein